MSHWWRDRSTRSFPRSLTLSKLQSQPTVLYISQKQDSSLPCFPGMAPLSACILKKKTASSRFRPLMLFSGTFPSESYHPHSKLSHTSLWQYSQAHKLAALHSVLHREATAVLPEQNLESSSPVQNPSVALAWLWLERGHLTHTHAAAVSLGHR